MKYKNALKCKSKPKRISHIQINAINSIDSILGIQRKSTVSSEKLIFKDEYAIGPLMTSIKRLFKNLIDFN